MDYLTAQVSAMVIAEEGDSLLTTTGRTRCEKLSTSLGNCKQAGCRRP